MYIVDTCVIVDSLRGHQPATNWLASNCSKLSIPTVVILELLLPTLSEKAKREVVNKVSPYHIVNPNDHDWARARRSYRNWNSSEKKPGIADLIIGETANGLNKVVATKNFKDFENICDVEVPY